MADYDTFLFYSPEYGSDTTGTGAIGAPYQTQAKCWAVSDTDAVAKKYTIAQLGGVCNEEYDLSAIEHTYGARLVFMFSGKMRGLGTANKCALRFRNGNNGAYEVWGADIDGYDYVLSNGTGFSGYSQAEVFIYDSVLSNGKAYMERGYFSEFHESVFNNITYSYTANGNTEALLPRKINKCTFYSCNDLIIGDTFYSSELSYNIFKNTSLTFYLEPDTKNNIVLDSCEAKFVGNITWANIQLVSYASVISINELNTKRNTDIGTSDTDYGDGWVNFDTIDFLDDANDNLFLASKDLYQYNNSRHIGAHRYAIYVDSTQMTASSGGSVANGYAESTSAPSTGIEFICDAIEFDTQQIIKRIHAIIDLGDGGELMTSNATSATQRSIDVDMCFSATKTATELDAAPESYSNYQLGVTDAATLEYGGDVGEVALSCKPKFTLKNEGSSTDFGEVKVYQIIIETEDVYFFENETEYEVPQQDTTNSKNAGFTDTTELGWVSACEFNINQNSSVTRQAIIDAHLTALALSTGQTVFTITELIALAGATPADSSDITLYSSDDTNGLYIEFKTDSGEITQVGFTNIVTP